MVKSQLEMKPETEPEEITNKPEKVEKKRFVPKRIFIVPYRNRIEQKFFFSKQMSFILEDDNDYEIYFSHQCDNRHFNRGATRNIGFLAMKEKYPDNYKNITFIFNDVDTLPFHKIFDYQTTRGVVKHYYGFEYALGGIVVIKGGDFEKINGYPNFWGWGNEDKVLQLRCQRNFLRIDRSQFYKIGSPEILQLFDGVSRLISPRDYHLGNNDSGVDGLSTIGRLTFSIDDESLNPKDNKYLVTNERLYVINILSFLTGFGYEQNRYYNYDLRDPVNKIIYPDAIKQTSQRVVTTDDWKNIDQSIDNKRRALERRVTQQVNQQIMRPQQQQQQQQRDRNTRQYPPMPSTHSPYSAPPTRSYTQNQNVNVFSPEYARYIGARPRATTSANIRLGGVARW
jgi:hypothetical protein